MRNDLKRAREDAGLTQQDLAAIIGENYASSNICRIEAGEQNVSVEVAPKLAAALGLDVLDVLYPKLSKRGRAA